MQPSFLHRGIVFNRELIRQYQLDDPYDLVKNNQWTLEKMAEMVSGVSANLDGMQEQTDEDRYGFLSEDTSNVVDFVAGIGEPIFVTNTDGDIKVSIYNERAIKVLEILRSMLSDPVTVRDFFDLSEDGSGYFIYGRRLFSEDHFLFMQANPRCFDELTANNMESEYGIVPTPKIDTAQEKYQHRPDRNSSGLVVPTTNQPGDLERISIILEDMAYMSSKTVVPDYYETIIALRRARVPELGEMVDLIKNTVYYDITYIHNLDWQKGLTTAYQSGNFGSTFTRYEKMVNNSAKQLVKSLEALG